jgi:hypothetical protein
MRPIFYRLMGILAVLAVWAGTPARGSVQLSWNPSPSPTVSGYYLVWGTNSGDYVGTNSYDATTTNATLAFSDTNVYYIAVAAFDSNNVLSQFSNEIMVTNSASTVTNQLLQWPPSPTNSPTNVCTTCTNCMGCTNCPNCTNSVGGPTYGGPPVKAVMWGVPPSLGLTVSNAQPTLNIAGTVGQTLQIECTTNPGSLYYWSPVTNVTVTNISEVAATNPPQSPDALDLAFVPAAQQFALPPAETNVLFYRAVMPYDYIVLAGQVLPQKGYPARLILINMVGFSDDACYVTAESSFIHFSSASNTFELQSSGSTIRQIADQLSGSLQQNWTTASEFIYSNGMGLLEATVVKTEDPSRDPVAQNPPSSQTQINF